MTAPVKRIVIAGGGTAGWLSACLLASWSAKTGRGLAITLIEAPDIPTIGVGEGTWPTMRETLAAIGLDEAHFLRRCDGAFKQGSRFDGWTTGAPGDSYHHPFTPPPAWPDPAELAAAWAASGEADFAAAMSPQPALCDADLAPRQRGMPAYAGAVNYAYHLDASKLAGALRERAVEGLGVRHVADRIEQVEGADGWIEALRTAGGGRIAGDLFLDCTGLRALLIEGHCKAGWTDLSGNLFNDRALALQVPVDAGSPIASHTIGTAHEAGWLWDIALPSRRGIGCVYSSRHLDEARARAILADYVARAVPGADVDAAAARLIAFPTGHRASFWRGNCLAVGLSAGFVEPLEASAIVLIELSIRQLTANFPASRERMPFLAERFDALFTLRWQRVVEFLKLHYVLSRRGEPYWQEHRDRATWPARLGDLIELWRDQPPSTSDLPMAEEMFPAASYQYVYYGMGGALPTQLPPVPDALAAQLRQVHQKARALAAALPTNRTYFDALAGASQPDPQRQSAA
ncbi:tryptophan 7-halogenase [Sphingomonas sabuli]|uniref:Tryptophan 7-halogenase n=1 Tax=Sphingomonas sabuli TaxID=2764186 RepID=A0A7G9KZB0_9SPHN|nr:tryptophan halogenase family protein [Sphingomonas sabuli]QNM81709.1 tryptophan 7-halogenase [Sphingomonas sabuli]